MLVAVAGMSHRRRPRGARAGRFLAVRRAWLCKASQGRPGAWQIEAVLLSTCNRTRSSPSWRKRRRSVCSSCSPKTGRRAGFAGAGHVWLTDAEGRADLYRVALPWFDGRGRGSDPRQVREAYRAATEEHCAGQSSTSLFHYVAQGGKKVRSERVSGIGPLSVPRVAVKLAEEVFGSLAERRASSSAPEI